MWIFFFDTALIQQLSGKRVLVMQLDNNMHYDPGPGQSCIYRTVQA